MRPPQGPPQTAKNKNIEQRPDFTDDPDPLFEGYFDEIRNRQFRPRTAVDVEKVVALELVAPITPLSYAELEKLKYFLAQYAQTYIDTILNKDYRLFAEHAIYWINDAVKEKLQEHVDMRDLGLPPTPLFLDSTTVKSNPDLLEILKVMDKLEIAPLLPEELISLITNPKTMRSAAIVKEITSRPGNGEAGRISASRRIERESRHLYSREDIGTRDDYGYSNAGEFADKLEKIRQRTEKPSLIMLDIGGNTGTALADAKRADPALKTINMTTWSALTTEGDIIIRRPAEYMPAELEEKIDVIESNMSFTYFIFPDIALINTIKALSVGGEANVSFSNGNCPLDREELLSRMKKVFAWLKELDKKGYIEVARDGDEPFSVEKTYFHKQLRIIKKKSTVGL